MSIASRIAFMSGLVVLGCASQACSLSSTADRFREAVPQQGDVALNVPGGNGTGPGTGAGTRSVRAGLHIKTGNEGGSSTTATSYGFTREITTAVDSTTAVIVGSIWAIANIEPTTLEDKKAVWGPSEDSSALEPVIWRFTVNEVATDEYDYALEGKPKAGGDYLPVLSGHGYGNAHPDHKKGWFQANNDNFKKLDPSSAENEGTTKITYDLKQLPSTINVELRPKAEEGSLDVDVTHATGGAGSVRIHGTFDIDKEDDAAAASKLENVEMTSRWDASGAGRSEWTFSGGDLPIASVTATECWSTSFSRVYYKDSADSQPTEGAETACAVSAAKE